VSILRRAIEARTVQQFGDSSIPTNGSLMAPTASGVAVNDQTAMQLIAVQACVRILASAIARLPLRAMVTRDGIQVPVPSAPAIVADPFGGAASARWPTRRAGLKQLAASLLLRGNGYAMVTARDYLLRPTRVMVLHPDVVRVTVADDGGRDYEVNRIKVDDPADMLHVTGMCMPGAATGISPIAYARQAIGLGMAAETYGAGYFGRGAHMTGIITTDADLDKAKARQLKQGFEASHGGLANAHAVGVLSGGAKWTPISVSPEDAQFLGTRAAASLDVAMLYGIPPHMLGQVDRTTSWGTGIEQQALGFRVWTLDDWLGTIEDAWTAMLPRGQAAAFDTAELERTDTAGRWAYYQIARNIAGMTPDEIRARENMPPLPDGQGGDPFAPLNSAHTTDPGWKVGQTEPPEGGPDA
jgi:HK97 family phage portal protein